MVFVDTCIVYSIDIDTSAYVSYICMRCIYGRVETQAVWFECGIWTAVDVRGLTGVCSNMVASRYQRGVNLRMGSMIWLWLSYCHYWYLYDARHSYYDCIEP